MISLRTHCRVLMLTLLCLGLWLPLCARADDVEPPSSVSGSRLPASCLPDFSSTLEAPAGKRGFLTHNDNGHFYWSDGTRARFWGINVSSTRLDIPPEEIDQVVENFARAGLNLVRLEAIDNRNCLLGRVDAHDFRHFDAHYLDRLDRWIASLRRHGIYYYLDLLDFRTFKDGDGVANADSLDRGARPYALYDRYLIQLQKEYATHLLTHYNPYTGLRLVDDPALAMVEICNEHGFFLYPDKLETLVEPYRSDLRGQWNKWLRDHYTTREKLAAAWGAIGSFPVLRGDEDPIQKTVDLPALTRPPLGIGHDSNIADVRRAPARVRDGVQFLAQIQRAYFAEIRDHLRAIGLQAPITAVVSNDVVPDVASVAQECDFTAENWYSDGSEEDARTPGLRYYNNRNPLREDGVQGFAPFTAGLRWNNKPVVIREWATTWPNRFRAASVPEALAYAALQDYDAVLLFGYQTNRAPNGADADALNDYSFQSDPTVWGLYALAGRAFLSGALSPATHTLTLVYPPDRQFAWPNQNGDLNRAAWSVRLNSVLADAAHSPGSLIPTRTGDDLQNMQEEFVRLARRGAAVIPDSLASGVWRSDTGQITLYAHEGRLEVVTPTLCMLAGEFTPNHVYALGKFRFSTPTTFGALMLFSLDGRPLEKSGHIVAKMVSRAENSGQVLQAAPAGSPNPWVLRVPGAAPVLTFGRAAAQPTRLWLVTSGSQKQTPAPLPSPKKGKALAHSSKPGKKAVAHISKPVSPPPHTLLSLNMVDGAWELEIREGRITLACDTPGIPGLALGHAFTTTSGLFNGTQKTASGRLNLAPEH